MTAPTVPSDASGLLESLTDSSKLKAIKDNGGYEKFIDQYVAQFGKADGGETETQVKELFDKFIVDWARDNDQDESRLKRLNLAPGQGVKDKGAKYNPDAPGAKLEAKHPGLVNNPREFLRNIYHGNDTPSAREFRQNIRNDFSSVVPADGGFLVPETLRSQLLELSLESSIVRPRAMVIPMESARVPFPVLESTSNVSSVFGGMIAYWTEEAGTLQKSQAKFARVVLDAKKLTGYSVVPNELFTDSIISMEAFLSQKWPQALAFTEDAAHFNGTGVGEPLGFLRAAATVSVAKESGQAANTIGWENIVKMYSRMLPTSLGSAVWVANINTFPELATMALTVGTGGGPVWLTNGTDGPPMTILGRPVIFTEKAATLGTVGDLSFVDLSYYMVGDRQTMQMATSEHVEFDTDQTAVRIIQRGDGRPWIQSAITPHKGADTLSPFVNLATRA